MQTSITTTEAFHANGPISTAFWRHLTQCPPHGAYARLAAFTFSELARTEFQISISPLLLLQLIRESVMIDHMRTYVPLYVASDISSVDVEKLNVAPTSSPSITN